METFTLRRIMVPLDFSETSLLALEHAAGIAQLFNAELYLLHVIELYEYTFNIYEPLVNINTEETETMLRQNLETHAERLRSSHGIQVVTILARGRVSAEIADEAVANKIDLIVMGTHGAKGFSEYFVGSNAHRTVTLSPCPVLTIREKAAAPGFRDIVMPIDNSLHSRQKVDTVIAIAKKFNAKVHLLGLLHEDEKAYEKKFGIKIESVEHALKKAHVAYEKKIVNAQNLAVESMNYAEAVKADLVTIMTDHESNLTGMFLGGFAKQIINHSAVPILSIRPLEGNVNYSFGGGGYA